MLLVINFEGRSTSKRKWRRFGPLAHKKSGNQGKKTYEHICFRVVSVLLSLCALCNEIRSSSVFSVKSPVVFLKYLFEFVFNTAGPVLSDAACQPTFHGKSFIKILCVFFNNQDLITQLAEWQIS